MISARHLLALGLLLGAVAPAAAKPVAKPVAATADWSRHYAVTPEGGFVVGNPKARIALVEYGSLTCSHCRHFAQTAVKPLMARYVRTGKASYEFRPLILNGVDIAANLVARCNGPSQFFPIAERLYATQPTWAARVTEAQIKTFDGLSQPAMMLRIAQLTGLVRIASAYGIPPTKSVACLKSEAAAEQLTNMARAADDRGVHGTPTFFINGKLAEVMDWATLEPLLKKAGG